MQPTQPQASTVDGTLILQRGDLYGAAVAYLAKLAYPEPELSGRRSMFERALLDYCAHSVMQQEGRAAALSLRAPDDDRVIRRGNFQRRLDHGLDRICRSMAVHHLYSRRQRVALCTFTLEEAKSKTDAINDAMPDWTEIIRDAPLAWKKLLALNTTGDGADDDRERVRKLLRRGIRPFASVLPLASGLASAAPHRRRFSLGSIKNRLLKLVFRPERWLDRAVEAAQAFRHYPYPRGGEAELHPARLVEVLWQDEDGEIIRPEIIPPGSLPLRRIAKPRRQPARTAA